MNILKLHELKEMQENKEDFLLLNVLSEDSFQNAHIPGSYNAPLADREEFLKKVVAVTGIEDKNRRIVTYCAGFHCSASKNAANLLIGDGYANVAAYEGGMEEWADDGNPIDSATSMSCDEQCTS